MYWPPLYTGHYFFPYIPWTSASQLPKSPLNNWQIAYKTAYFLLQSQQNSFILHVAGLCFCLVSVLLLYFDCVTNLHATINIFGVSAEYLDQPFTCVAALWRMRYLTNWMWFSKVCTPFDNEYVSSQWSKCCGFTRCSWVYNRLITSIRS